MTREDQWAIGVDLGGTKIEVAQVAEGGQLRRRVRRPTNVNAGPSIVKEDILVAIRSLTQPNYSHYDSSNRRKELMAPQGQRKIHRQEGLLLVSRVAVLRSTSSPSSPHSGWSLKRHSGPIPGCMPRSPKGLTCFCSMGYYFSNFYSFVI
jgi:hypothetical protein